MLEDSGRAVPFYLTREAREDTSHTLVRADGMHASLHESGVPRWLSAVGDLPHVVGAELFVTEGYDTAFSLIACSYQSVADVLEAHVVLPGDDYPSIRLSISRGAGSAP